MPAWQWSLCRPASFAQLHGVVLPHPRQRDFGMTTPVRRLTGPRDAGGSGPLEVGLARVLGSLCDEGAALEAGVCWRTGCGEAGDGIPLGLGERGACDGGVAAN